MNRQSRSCHPGQGAACSVSFGQVETDPDTPLRSLPSFNAFDALKNPPPPSIKLEGSVSPGAGYMLPMYAAHPNGELVDEGLKCFSLFLWAVSEFPLSQPLAYVDEACGHNENCVPQGRHDWQEPIAAGPPPRRGLITKTHDEISMADAAELAWNYLMASENKLLRAFPSLQVLLLDEAARGFQSSLGTLVVRTRPGPDHRDAKDLLQAMCLPLGWPVAPFPVYLLLNLLAPASPPGAAPSSPAAPSGSQRRREANEEEERTGAGSRRRRTSGSGPPPALSDPTT